MKFLLIFSTICLTVLADRPNIVFILADDMGVGDVSGLNPEAKVSTPNLDKLIANGMHFTDAHTSSAVCTPTRYGLLTGRYNWRSELKAQVVNGYGKPLIAPDRDTVANLLKRNGYRTAMIGKWHLGLQWSTKDGSVISDWRPEGIEDIIDFAKPFRGGPVDHGFDWYYGINASLDFPPYTFLENDRVAQLPTEQRPFQGGKENKQIMMRGGLQSAGFRPEMVLKILTGKAVDYIQQQQRGTPFFLYLPLNSPHTPVVPREPFLGTSQCGIYGDFIHETDWAVGEVVKALKSAGLLEDTLLIFTADNGASKSSFSLEQEEQYDHHPSYLYKGRKSSLDEGGHRVPFIAYWPGSVEERSQCDTAFCLNDLYATCAALVGGQISDSAAEDSFNMLPLLQGRDGDYIRNGIVHHDFAGRFAYRSGKWKLQFHRLEDRTALYDMEADPYQKKNLYKDYPEVVKRLEAELTAIVQNGRSTPGPPQSNDGPQWWEQLVWIEPPSGN